MKNDARFIKNEEKIKDTFKQMVCEMRFEDITVKELTARAKMNRKTFYLHYATIEELIKRFQIELSEEYVERIKHLDIFHDYHEVITQFYLFHVEKGEFIEKLTVDPNYEYIRNQMISKVEDSYKNTSIFKDMDPYVVNIAIAFLNSTTLSIYKAWVKDNKQIPLFEIIDINYNLVKKGFDGLIKNTKKITS